jgi:2-polyprenyl-3-methyl-5-hydroxy-6-metoxy-1,4-benzoquinol methylase
MESVRQRDQSRLEAIESGYRRRCPCCGSDVSGSRALVSSRPPAEEIAFGELGPFLSGYAPDRVFFTYHRCEDCTTVYCPVYLTQEQLNVLYAEQPENMVDAPVTSRGRTQMAYFDLIRRHSRLAGGYLEVGADIGLFAEQCMRHGKFDVLWVCEPNRHVHAALAARLERADRVILRQSYSAGDLSAGAVSTAVLIHVLDHVLEPERMLRQIRTNLETSGILFVVTHDAASMLARLLGRRWPPYTLQHPHLFSAASVRGLLERVGFEVVETVKTKNYFPLAFLAKAFLSVLGIPPWLVPDARWPEVGLKLGNIAVIARKRD